jgi:hypothetical protein
MIADQEGKHIASLGEDNIQKMHKLSEPIFFLNNEFLEAFSKRNPGWT